MSVSDKGASASTYARRSRAAAGFYNLNPGVKKSLYSGAGGQENTSKVAGLLGQPPCCPSPSVYTVTYNGNENTGGTVPVDPSSPYKAGSTVTVLGTGGISRSGYLFIGWNTAADGSGSSYPAASTFTVTGNTVLYAQWTPSYTVTYSNYLSNGGGAPPVDILSPYAAGSTVTVLDNNHPYPEGPLVRAGYTFLGWYPAGFVHAGTYYVAGNTIVITSDITLLPYWEEDIS